MNARRVVGFHVLQDNGFVKIYNDHQVEIVKDSSSFFIEIKEAPVSPIKTCMIELDNEKIILAFTDENSVLALLDLKTATCLTTRSIPDYINFLCALPDSTFLAVFIWEEKIYNYDMSEKQNTHLPIITSCTVLSDDKTILYATSSPATLVRMNDNVQLQIGPNVFSAFRNDKLSRVISIVSLPHNYVACLTEEGGYLYRSDYFLKIVDDQLVCRHSILLKKATYREVRIIDENYIALLSENNNILNIEIYDVHGKKRKDVKISNRSNQFFTISPFGSLISCSLAGNTMLHTLSSKSEESHKKIVEIESGLRSVIKTPNICLKVQVKIISSYLGLFSNKEIAKKIPGITYADKPKCIPRF